MVNDIKPIDPLNELVKFADDMTLAVPAYDDSDTSRTEVDSIIEWSRVNRISLNMQKTWEMIVHGNIPGSLPNPMPSIERKTWFKILGITLQDNPCNWDIHMHELISKASCRMYIMRVCKHYGLSKK